MARPKIKCIMPDKQTYDFQCEVQNIRRELCKETNQIPYDNIILIDEENQIYTSSSALYQTKNNQKKGQVIYNVVNALQLYKEHKELMNIKQDNYVKLLEIQKQLQKSEEDKKAIEIQYKNEIQSLSENNKSQSADICRQKEEQIDKIKAEKEQQIKEIQEKHNKLELDIDQRNKQITSLEQTIIQLQEENSNLSKNFDELQKKNEEQQKEIQTIIYDKITLNQHWQNCYNQLNSQSQQLYQQHQIAIQKNTEYYATIESLQIQIRELQDNSKRDVEKLKLQLKQEKDKLQIANDSLSNYENTNTSLNEKIKRYEKDIKQLKEKNNELELNYRNTSTNVQDATNTLSSKEYEIKKLQNNYRILTQSNQQLEQDKLDLQNYIQTLEPKITSQNSDINNLKSIIDQLNDDIDNHKEELRKKGLEIDKQKNELKNLSLQKGLIEQEYQELKNKLSTVQEELNNQETGGQNNQKEITKLKNQITKLEQEVNNTTKLNKENQDTMRQQKKDIAEKEGQISTLELKLAQIQQQLKQKEEQIKADQADNQKFKKQMDEIIQTMKSEIESANLKLNIKDHILQKLSKQMQDDKYYDKVTGVIDKLMSSAHKIKEFEKEQNAQFDLKDYEIFEITAEYNKAKELLVKNQYFLFEQCLKINPKGNVTLNRSIQPNAESTFFKGYLSVVKEATQNEFKGKFLLRKDLIAQANPFTTIEEAMQMSTNNFLCQLLMEQFNKVLQQQKIQQGDYKIARQFVLKLKDKNEYYYCEMVEEGEFKKINGGAFKPKVTEADSYFNAFSKFVYAFSKENYIITHLQICGKIVYDMIVSTSFKGLFSSIDQGPTEIGQFLENIDGEPIAIIGRHWNANIETNAKEGFK